MTEREAWIAFSAFPAIGPQRFKLLLQYFGSAEAAWSAPVKIYREIGFSERLASSFGKFRREFDIGTYQKRLEDLGVGITILEDKDYPERLASLEDAPFVLYVRKHAGVTDSLADLTDISLAVIGTRKMTLYGKDVCERLVTQLVDRGMTIVSGLALGIDSVAHRTALGAGGKTVAVLAGGVESVYPPSNTGLGREIVKNGAIISEYPLGYPCFQQNFPVRNRIVSGLALGVLVIEGSDKSGTLLTAASAARQGREVFAVPGPITSPVSRAPNLLIRQGAKLVESAKDILEELNVNSKIQMSKSKKVLPGTKEEESLLKILDGEGLDIDSLVRISGMQTGDILGSLMQLELKGLVKNAGGIYSRVL